MKWQHFQDFSHDYDNRCVPYDYDSDSLAGVYQIIRTLCTLTGVYYVILKACILAGVHHVIMTAPYSDRGVSFQRNILTPAIKVYFGF